MNNVMEFVKLAVSKEESRYNLCEIYRGKDKLVATDGNRLHYVNGMQEVKPHFPSGLDAEFPDYDQVLPKTAPTHTANLKADKDVLQFLKPLVEIAKCNDKGCASKVTFTESAIKIEVVKDLAKAELCIGLSESTFKGSEVVGINLRYIYEVLNFAYKSAKYFPLVELEFYGVQQPLILKVPCIKGVAIIMPMRLPK